MSGKLSAFPLLGVEYGICLSAKDEGGNEYKNSGDASGDSSALWFKAGGGLDFSFTQKVYLRFEALYGIRLSNKMEDGLKDQTKLDTRLGHGLTAKLAVGYKF